MGGFGLGLFLLLLPLRAWSQCSSTWHCPGEGSGTTHNFSSMSECQAKVEEALFAWKHLGGGGCAATACSCGSGGSSEGSGSDAAAAAAQAREYVNQLEGRNAELRGRVQTLEGRKEELTRKKQAVEEKKSAREAERRERQRLWDLKDAKDELGRNLKPGAGGGLETGFKDFIAEAENNRRWEKHRHAALALQREATAKSPANKENETWCKLNTLLAPGPERMQAWDRRCDPGRKVPPYIAAVPRLEPVFKSGSEAAPLKTPEGVLAQSVQTKAAVQAEFKLPDPEPVPSSDPSSAGDPVPESGPTTPAEPGLESAAAEEPSERGLPENAGDLASLEAKLPGETVSVATDEEARAAASSGFDDKGPVLAPETREPPPASAPEAVTPQEAAGVDATPAASAPISAAPAAPAAAAAPPPRTVTHCAGSECREQRVIAELSAEAPERRWRRAADCAAASFLLRLQPLGGEGAAAIGALRASIAAVLAALKDGEVSAPASDQRLVKVGDSEVQVVSRISGTKTGYGDVHLDLQWSVNEDGVESEESVLLFLKPDGTAYGQSSEGVERCLRGG